MSGLSPAAAAALGVQPPAPQPERLAWVDLDSNPRTIAIADPSTGEPLGQYAQFDDDLPMTDLMADKARAVCDLVDQSSCEALGCQSGPGYTRPDGSPATAGIGWVLAGEADERTEWRAFAVVQRGRKVIAVCLDCSPTTIYEGLWEAPDSTNQT